jgi:NADPH:quinone reductase-like Zn-dependent oxidoreductase
VRAEGYEVRSASRVASAGAYAEYVAAPSRNFARKPAGISHVQAAALPVAALTAWQALVDTADVQPGQRVLIHAAAGGWATSPCRSPRPAACM